MLNLEGAKESIEDFLDIDSDTSWIEGWICGYTDDDHKYKDSDKVHDELFDYLNKLKEG